MAGSSFRDSVSGLEKPRRGRIEKVKKNNSGEIVPKAGVGLPNTGGKAAANSGIASPLTEQALPKRKIYSTTHSITSSDGLFTIEYHCLKSIVFKDANEALVQFNFLDIDPEDGVEVYTPPEP